MTISKEWQLKEQTAHREARVKALQTDRPWWAWWDSSKSTFKVTKEVPFWGTSATRIDP